MKTTTCFIKNILTPVLILSGILGLSSGLSAQCDTEVSGVFTYCNAIGVPGDTGYFVAFRVFDPTGDTLNVVDLDGNNITNRGKRINDINAQNEPATVTITPLMITGVGADSLEFWYFGPYANGSTFNIALVDPDNICDTVFVASGTYDCMDNTGISDPMACDNDVPLYFLDFSQTEFEYGGGGGGNESFDEIFLVMQRTRESMCCDLQPANQSCFEFIIRLGDQDIGLTIDDVGSGSPGGELYADTLNNFACTGVSATTWPFTQSGGQSQDLPLCLFEGQEFVVLSCKSGGNVTGASIDAISNIFSPPVVTVEPCNASLEVFNADTVMWSSPNDPGLNNLLSCTGDSIFCTFLYDTLTFGEVTTCEGDTFYYYVGSMPPANECFNADTILYDTTFVIVYPNFTVNIDSSCSVSGDSIVLTAMVTSAATGCDYLYNWSTGDTTVSITVPVSMAEYSVTVTRADIPLEAQGCVETSDTIVAQGAFFISCENITDTLYSCISQLPASDTTLVIVEGCGIGDPFIFVEDLSNEGAGCVDDSLIITRLYIVDFDGDTINTTTDRDTCTQALVFVDEMSPIVDNNCPQDTTVVCTTEDLSFIDPPTYTDNCAAPEDITVSFRNDTISGFDGTCTNDTSGVIRRVWFGEDLCGNVDSSCVQFIFFIDTLAPAISCPADTIISCADTSSVFTGTPVISDNCDPDPSAISSDMIIAGGCPQEFIINRTWTASDVCGNTASCLQVITVIDTTGPSITCPADLTVQCSALVPAADTAEVTATDDCGIATITFAGDVVSDSTCANRLVVTRTYIATDECGNSSSCTQTITVFDDTAPLITCPADITVDCADDIPAANIEVVIATDNCGGEPTIAHIGDAIINMVCANSFTVIRTYSATDECGNAATCTQMILVSDQIPPSITCPADVTVECANQVPPVNTGSVVTSDNCPGVVTVTHAGDVISNMTCTNQFTVTRTYLATDVCGNSATCTQTITVFDDEPPILICPADTIVECRLNVPAANTSSVFVNDNCAGIIFVTVAPDVISNETCPDQYTITRVYTASDVCGNSTTCAQTITVFDDVPPSITCPPDVTLDCSSEVPDPDTLSVTATDNCGGTPVIAFEGDSVISQVCSNGFIVLRTYSATDSCGNSSTCVQSITVSDTISPLITCPADLTIECANMVPAADTALVTASDNCEGIVVIAHERDSITNMSCVNEFVILRIYSATDECGNSATCVQTITVFDDTVPVITCPADISIECGSSTDPQNTGTATATDNCGGDPDITFADGPASGICPLVFVRTWTATDECGNSSTCLQTITLLDSTLPVITCPADTTVSCTASTLPESTGEPVVSDNCDTSLVVDYSDVTISGACPQEYTINRTWVATDDCGNSASCLQVITIDDDTPPVITCPQDTTVECAGDVPAPDIEGVTATDDCGPVTEVIFVNDVTVNEICANRFEINRTYQATDACGNTATCIQVITVFDDTPPTITCPADITVECESDVPTPEPASLVTSDNCGGTVVVTHGGDVISNMICPNQYTLTRTYVATDECGNTSSCVQIITVFDNTAPEITCPANVTVACADEVPEPSTDLETSDNCDGTVTITSSDTVINIICPNNFTLERTYTATDECGNSSTCTQVIMVFDDVPPVITCPSDVTVSCASEVPAADPGSVTATDNCSGTVTVTHQDDVISGMQCVNQFIVTRTYLATDSCGNTSSCSQIITVNDQTAPVITCPPDITIHFEENTDPSNTGNPTATDNCGGTPEFSFTDVIIPGECVEEYTIERTWTATDDCGNTATCLQTIVLDEGCAFDLSLEKVLNGGQTSVMPGEDVTFTITVFNEGMGIVGSITIIDYIPLGFTLNDPDWMPGMEGSTGQSATIELSVGNGALPPGGLLPGQNVSVDITLQADIDIMAGEYVNTAEISEFFDLAGNDVSDNDIDSDPDEDDLNDPPAEDDHDSAIICVQPAPVITGDNFVCPGDTVTYSVAVFNPENTYTWILQNGGGQIIEETDSSVTIVWQQEPGGAFVLELTEVASATCQGSTFVLIFIQGDDVLACNDHINISIDEDCSSVILSGMILEGELFGDDNYVVIIIDQNGDTIPNATVTAEHVGQTFVVKVLSECSGQSCWGTISVEDKIPPQIICECPVNSPQPDSACQITCLEVDQLVNGVIPPALQPEVIDNCGGAVIEIIHTELNFDNCEGGNILVTWKATDIAGNMATCQQEFIIVPLTLDSLVFPDNYLGECGSSVDPEVTGWPTINGVEIGEALCNIFTGYWDKELAECGGGRKIVRTWTVLDWCTVELVEATQIIKLTDTQPPVLECPSDLTVGTDFWYCYANVSVPKPIAHDVCSDITSYSLTSTGGEVVAFGNNFVINQLVPGTYQVTWTVADECGNSSTCSFALTVIDNVVPVANCDQHTIVSLTNDGPSGITLVSADVFDDGSYDNCGPVTFRARRMDSCIDFDWTTEGACIDHIPGGVPPVNSRDRGTVHRPCVPFACCDVGNGPVMVELEVTDASGNVNYCMVEVTVQDKISPILICPPDITVSCDFWFAVEEGTFVDAEGNNDGTLDEDPLSSVFGNMFDAFRFDESVRESIVINDPANELFPQPHTWGLDGWADDNCEVNLQVRVRIFDDCSGDDLPSNAPPGAVKLIERRFSAIGGEEGVPPGTCTQRIWVIDFDPFFITDQTCNNPNPNDGVIWPCDVVLTTCPDDLSGTGEPVIFDDACSLIGVSYEDTRFNFVDSACFKILRDWKVIDWCQYDPVTGAGLWSFTQVIKVHDHEGAEFLDCPSGPVELCVGDPGIRLPATNQAFLGEDDPNASSCSAHVTLSHIVRDACSNSVRYDVKFYPFNGNEFIQIKPLSVATLDEQHQGVISFDTEQSNIQSIRRDGLPYNGPWCGNYHRLLWTVEDACSNLSTCEYLIRLVDCKQPSPVCINGLSTVVMPTSGQVTIWAKDFDASSFDDCTPAEELLFSFDGDIYQPSFTYTCDNVPAFGLELTTQIWVADGGYDQNCNGQIEWNERNKDFCTTTIVINDNDDVCDTSGTVLAGEILTPHTMAVSNVTVSLSTPGGNYPAYITGTDGKYIFNDLPLHKEYTIQVSRNDNHRNGVSTLDLVQIQKHLLGKEEFNDPHLFIAADANNSHTVSAIDLVELRKLILGIYTTLPENSSWRFVDRKYVMADPAHPWPHNDFITIENLSESILNNDFVAIKVGDVNNTVVANANQIVSRNAHDVLLVSCTGQLVAEGQTIDVTLKIPEDVIGFQWTLETSGLEFESVTSEDIAIDDSHIGVLGNGIVTTSWNGVLEGPDPDRGVEIKIRWKALQSGNLQEMMRMTNSIAQAEAYRADGEIMDVKLVFGTTSQIEFALFQNTPNPWSDHTVIGFNLPEENVALLTLYDMTGKVLKTIEGVFGGGYNEISLVSKELPSGVLYYRLESGSYSASKKMVLIR